MPVNSASVKYDDVCSCERLSALFVSVFRTTSLKVKGVNKRRATVLSVLKEEVNRKVSLQTRGIHFSIARTYFRLVVCDCHCQRTINSYRSVVRLLAVQFVTGGRI